MGGEKRSHIVFRLQWPYDSPETMKLVEGRDVRALAINPRFARTDSDNIETAVPTMPQTRIHSALPKRPMIRWAKIDELGSGVFGEASFQSQTNIALIFKHLSGPDCSFFSSIRLTNVLSTSKVNRAVDVDTGKLIAVKIVKIRQDQHKAASFALLKREIEAIGRIEHVSRLGLSRPRKHAPGWISACPTAHRGS